LVVGEHVLQISLKLSDALQSPSLDLVAAATEADDVNMLRHMSFGVIILDSVSDAR
jgi:hypothetical protein